MHIGWTYGILSGRSDRRTGTTVLRTMMAVLISLGASTVIIAGSRTGTGMEGQTTVSSPDSLSGATVTAWRMQASPSDSISGERLKAVQTVADAVRFFKGIQLKDYGGVGGLKTVNVRSLGSEHTGVFMDGIQIGNAQNAQADLGRFSTEDLAAIRLYGGQQDKPLQSAREYASGAAVQLCSAIPDFSDGKKFHGRVRLKGGSFGTISPYLRWEQKLGRNVSMAASVEYLKASGRYRFRCRKEYVTEDGSITGYDTTMTRSNSDIQALRAEAGLFGKVREGEWSVKAYYYGSGRGLPGAVVRRPERLSMTSDRQEDRNIFIQGSISRQAGSRYSFRLAAKYANDRLHYHNDPATDISAMPVDDSYMQHEAYLSLAQAVQLFPWWRLSIATDVLFNALDSDKRDFVRPRRATFWGAAYTAFCFKRINIQAGATYCLAADFFLTPLSSGNAGNSGQTGGGGKDTRDMVSPSISFRYVPSDRIGLAICGFMKRSYRLPTFNDLYYVNTGNVMLDPEDAMQYDLRIDYGVSPAAGWSLSAKAEGYFNNVRDKIIAVPTSNQFRWTMYNIGHAHVIGAEGIFGWTYRANAWQVKSGRTDIRKGFSAGMTAGYTFQRGMDMSRPGSSTYRGQIPYIPVHSGTVSAFVSWRGWRADYSFIYTGVRYSSSANLKSTRMQPWSTHDISLSGTLRKGLVVRLSVNNILNRQYEVVPNYPMPRCNFMVSAEYGF